MWVHVLPGRARARVPGLRGNPALAARLAQQLTGRSGVHRVWISSDTGTVLFLYAPETVTLAQLAAWLPAAGTAAAAVAAGPEVAAAVEPACVPAAAGPGVVSVTVTSPPRSPVPTGARPQPVEPAAASGPVQGLTAAQVQARRARFGPNLVTVPPPPPFWRRLLAQYQDILPLTLVGSAALSLLSGHRRDALTMGAVLLLNGLIGASQSGGPTRPVAALRRLGERPARVVRDGAEATVPAAALVPGDLLLLEQGDVVQADASVRTASGLALDESLLTGESTAADKGPDDPVHAGTAVVRGRGRAVVTATGDASALGQIARLLTGPEPTAPLQRQLDHLGRRIARAGLWAAAGATALGLWRGLGPAGALLSGISLAVAAVPEGLPAFLTVALAAGTRRLAQRGGTCQNLAAVETMGAVSAVCCDKTGTLTRGEMSVAEIHLPTGIWQVTGDGYSPEGEFRQGGRPADPLTDPALRRLLKVAALCTNARLGLNEQGALVTHGDPTEIALLVAALKAGLRACGGEGDRLLEIPFDAVSRHMTVVCQDASGQAVACSKGAPEALLARCSQTLAAGRLIRLEPRLRRRLQQAAAEMAARGLRVLAVAYGPADGPGSPAAPAGPAGAGSGGGLVLLGLLGLSDLPRPEAADTVRRCRQAGVQVLMLTGDHPGTAAAVARQIGIPAGADRLLTGGDLAGMTDRELDAALPRISVVARVTPEQKLRVVQALRRTGQTVAMLGDGVNDAPAMRAADIGIAMGERGSEVTRAGAGLVLEDDHLPVLADAITQGRATAGNIRRMARYLLGQNAAEVCLMAGALLLGLPLPLLPAQLLWLNLAGDGLPATALGAEPPAADLPPSPPDPAPAPRFGRQAVGYGLRTGLTATALYAWALAGGRPLNQARTLAMATLTAAQVRHLHACRSPAASPQVRTAGAVAVLLGLSAFYFPPLRQALQLAPPGPGDLALAAGATLAMCSAWPEGSGVMARRCAPPAAARSYR